MKKKFLIITDKPNFYKTNLYNQLNKNVNLHVIYVNEEKINRENFFYSKNMDFSYKILTGNKVIKMINLFKELLFSKFHKIIISGWDNILYILVIFFFKSDVVIETTKFDKNRSDLYSKFKNILKKIFALKVNRFLCAGLRHSEYIREIFPKKKIKIINTVGFPFNKKGIKFFLLEDRKDFVFIGRNSPEKNIEFMVNVFQKSKLSKENNLVLVGDKFEKYRSYEFIKIYEVIPRDNMIDFLKRFRALLLLSKSESYGLVIEEALRCGIPVICSSKCGIVDTLVFDNENSLVVNIENEMDCIEKIDSFDEKEIMLNKNIESIDFAKRDQFTIDNILK